MKKWIAVSGHPLCGGLNALLHIAVIFTMHRKRNVVNFYINFSFMKVFKKKNKKKIIAEFFELSFACALKLLFFILSLDYNLNIYTILKLCNHMFYLIWLKKKQKHNDFIIINAEPKSVGFSDYLKHIYG